MSLFQQNIQRFDKGYISPLDIDTLKAIEGALADCRNVEINDRLYAVRSADGFTSFLQSPAYSGESLAFRMWSNVDGDIPVLVKQSNNLLLYSEDFEISSKWVFNPAGATLLPNFSSGPTRFADRIASPTDSTALTQSLDSSHLYLVSGRTIVFSLYVKASNGGEIILKVNDGVSETSETFSATTSYTRISLSHNTATEISSLSVQIQFSAQYSHIDIFGAQLEINDSGSPSAYGKTTLYVRPIYVFVYVNNAWLELTESVAGVVTSATANGFAISNFNYADGYFEHWRVLVGGSLLLYVYSYDNSTKEFDVVTSITPGQVVVLSRFIHWSETPYLSLDNLNHVQFDAIRDELRLTVSSSVRPLIIKRLNPASYFPAASKPIIFSTPRYNLLYSSHIGVSIPAMIGAPGASGSEHVGIGLVSLSEGVGGSLEAGRYYVSVVMLIEAQRFVVALTSIDVAVNGSTILVTLSSIPKFFSPRLSRIEVYAGTARDENSLSLTHSVLMASSQWQYVAGEYRCTVVISSIDSTQPTLLQQLGRSAVVETRARFSLHTYTRGRRYVASDSSDIVRFSHIRVLTECLDDFQYSNEVGYIAIEAGTSESIRALSVLFDGSLLIFKERMLYLYEAGTSRRLIRAFDGVGVSNPRCIVTTQYGVFWHDDYDVYHYNGSSIQSIGLGRVSAKLRTFQLQNTFAIFNKRLSEYWLFIPGDTTLIFRYSVQYNNWNILELSAHVVDASIAAITGQVIICLRNGALYAHGGYSLLTTPYIQTHRFVVPGTDSGLVELEAFYSTTSPLTLAVLVNDEPTVRNGNSIVLPTSIKRYRKQPRLGTNCKYIAVKVAGAPSWSLSLVSLRYVLRADRYGVV